MSDLLRTEIKTQEDFNDMERMISKECQRNSLAELCEYWGFDFVAFDDFISLAKEGLEKRNSENPQEEPNDN